MTCDCDPNFYLKYTAIYVGKPCIEEDYVVEQITPQQCRLRCAHPLSLFVAAAAAPPGGWLGVPRGPVAGEHGSSSGI